MKKITLLLALLLSLSAGTFLTSCGDDEPQLPSSGTGQGGESGTNPGEDENTPGGGNTTLSPAEAKVRMEQIATEVARKFNAADQSELIELLSWIDERYLSREAVTEPGTGAAEEEYPYYPAQVLSRTVRSLQAAAGGNVLQASGLARAMEKEDWDVSLICGLYEFSDEENQFVKTAESNRIDFRIVDREGNDVYLTAEPSADATLLETRDQRIYVPRSGQIVLKTKRQTLAEARFTNEFQVGTYGEATVSLTMGSYYIGFTASIETSTATASGVFRIGSEDILTVSANLRGENLAGTAGTVVTEENFENIRPGSGEMTLDVLGKLQVRTQIDDCEAFFALPDTWHSQAEAEAGEQLWNDRMATSFYFDGSSAPQGRVVYQASLDYSYPTAWGKDEEWSCEAVLLFGDDTRYAFEDYFDERDFSTPIDLFESFVSEVEAIWQNSRQ